jgi:hypothetical protein
MVYVVTRVTSRAQLAHGDWQPLAGLTAGEAAPREGL